MRNGEKYDSFTQASKKATKACITSDVSDASENIIAGKRIPKKKVFSSDESDPSESSGTLSDPPPVESKSIILIFLFALSISYFYLRN